MGNGLPSLRILVPKLDLGNEGKRSAFPRWSYLKLGNAD